MEEHHDQQGSPWGPGLKLYSNLRPPTDPQPMPEGFYEYIPEPKPELMKVAPGVVQAAVEARRKRILEKEKSKATTGAWEQSATGELNLSQGRSQYASAAGDGLGMGEEDRSEMRVVEAEAVGTAEIPSASQTYRREADTHRLQDAPNSRTEDGSKKRRIAGKQQSTDYPHLNSSRKRKAE